MAQKTTKEKQISNDLLLMMAASRGDIKAVEMLLEKGASVYAVDQRDNTALHYAAIRGDTEIITLLLNKRVNAVSI